MRYLLAIVLLVGCTIPPPKPFEPGAGGGPGPIGCKDQKERAARTGETPGC